MCSENKTAIDSHKSKKIRITREERNQMADLTLVNFAI